MEAIAAGLLIGCVIGAVASAICAAAGRSDQEQESDPREQRDADKY